MSSAPQIGIHSRAHWNERDVLAGRLRLRLLVEQQLEVHDVIA